MRFGRQLPFLQSSQGDADADGLDDACDSCPANPGDDIDGDGLCADADNWPTEANADQADADSNATGDACDLCPDNPSVGSSGGRRRGTSP